MQESCKLNVYIINTVFQIEDNEEQGFYTGHVGYLDKVGLSVLESWEGKSYPCNWSCLVGVVVVLGIILEPSVIFFFKYNTG